MDYNVLVDSSNKMSVYQLSTLCVWISAQHHGDHHHHQSQPQQPVQNEYDIDKTTDAVTNAQSMTRPQHDVIYGVIEKDPLAFQGRDKVTDNDQGTVIYSDLQSIDAGSHTVAPSDQLYANIGQ